MVWSLMSPDLSTIESVWYYMKRQWTMKLLKSTEQLWHDLQDALCMKSTDEVSSCLRTVYTHVVQK